MSKIGISVLSSYRGGYNFEAIGLSRALVGEFFPGMQSRISGIGLSGIARKVLALHEAAGCRNRRCCRWVASTSSGRKARSTRSRAS